MPTLKAQWQEISTATDLPVYVGLGYYYDPQLFLRQGQHTLKFYSFNMISLQTKIKVNDGAWQTYNYTTGALNGISFTPNYNSLAMGLKHTLTVQLTQVNGTYKTHIYDLYIVPPAQRRFKDAVGNTMTLWQGGSQSLDDPFLIVEGFDPKDNTNPAAEDYPEGYYALASSLFNEARTKGADILLMNYNDGGISLAENAIYVQNAVRYLHQIKTGVNKIKLAGLSMGGVIARYALTDAEQKQNPLPVSHFVSIDSPQQGAVIDRSFQDYIKESGQTNIPINSVAAKQMLKYNPFDSEGNIHTGFYGALNQLNGTGYPRLTKNIGVAFSNGQNRTGNEVWLRMRATLTLPYIPFGTIKSFNLNSETTQSGSFLPIESTMLQGSSNVQFGTSINFLSVNFRFHYKSWGLHAYWETTRYENPTFIPYNSALDIVNGQSKFDVTIQPAQTYFHNQLPPDVVAPLLVELGYLQPLQINTAGPQISGLNRSWTSSAYGGKAPYAYKWRYKMVCPTYAKNGNLSKEEIICTDQWSMPTYGSLHTLPSLPSSYGYLIEVESTDALGLKAGRTISYGNNTGSGGSSVIEEAKREDILKELKLFSYPNPMSNTGVISLEMPEDGNLSLKLYDILGKEQYAFADGYYSAGVQEFSLNPEFLSSGTYFIRAIVNERSLMHRLVIVK